MIRIQRIRIKEVDMTLQNRKELNRLRGILTKHFKTANILFDYDSGPIYSAPINAQMIK
jgi:hypothetical protein